MGNRCVPLFLAIGSLESIESIARTSCNAPPGSARPRLLKEARTTSNAHVGFGAGGRHRQEGHPMRLYPTRRRPSQPSPSTPPARVDRLERGGLFRPPPTNLPSPPVPLKEPKPKPIRLELTVRRSRGHLACRGRCRGPCPPARARGRTTRGCSPSWLCEGGKGLVVSTTRSIGHEGRLHPHAVRRTARISGSRHAESGLAGPDTTRRRLPLLGEKAGAGRQGLSRPAALANAHVARPPTAARRHSFLPAAHIVILNARRVNENLSNTRHAPRSRHPLLIERKGRQRDHVWPRAGRRCARAAACPKDGH